MTKHNSAKAFAVLLCLIFAFAGTASAASFPEKKASVYVYDDAEVISAETEADINSRADALYAMTGAQIMIVCVKTTGSTPINEYSVSLFNEWKIGSPQRDNGLLCVMATDDREYWLLQGNGIKSEITNGQLQVINNDYLEGYFADEKYDEGAKAVFDQLLLKFEALYSVDITKWDGKYIDFSYSETQKQENPDSTKAEGFDMMGFLNWFLWIAAGVVLIIIIVVVVSFFRRPRFVDGGYFRRRKYKGGRGPYIGIPPQSSAKSGAHRNSSARTSNPQSPAGQRNASSHPQRPAQYPGGQRTGASRQNIRSGSQPQAQYPADQRPAQNPGNKAAGGQRISQSREYLPDGQVRQVPPDVRRSMQNPNGRYPNGQYPNRQYPNGRYPNNVRQADRQLNGQRTGAEHPSDDGTVYPDRPPYINGAGGGYPTGAARSGNVRPDDDRRNGGAR